MVGASIAACAVAAEEPVEQARQLLSRDGRTLIDDSDAQLPAGLFGDFHFHGGAAARVARCVAHQVRQDAADQCNIDLAWSVADDLHIKPCLFKRGLVILDDGGGNRFEPRKSRRSSALRVLRNANSVALIRVVNGVHSSCATSALNPSNCS
jgi:hypothetical protein